MTEIILCSALRRQNSLVYTQHNKAETPPRKVKMNNFDIADEVLCGACGCFFDRTQADKEGFHKLAECSAYAEELN